MGKIREKRHGGRKRVVTAKVDDSGKQDEDKTYDTLVGTKKVGEPLFETHGLFSKVDIDINTLNNRLLPGSDCDTRSHISSKSMRGLNLSKKNRRKLKHEMIKKKIVTQQEKKREEAARKRRQSTAIVGDLRPLQESLSTLELLLKDTKHQPKEKKPITKVKAIQKMSTRRKQMMSDISLFQQVLAHPAYQANPVATITEHLENKLKQEAMDS